jgi:hypothetical protein
MTTVVISQPFFFPWVGLFEQIRLADVFVHYDDVAFSKGSFVNRVQIKSPGGFEWLTIPLKNHHLGDRILDLAADDAQRWQRQHYQRLKQYYRHAPYRDEMLQLVDAVYGSQHRRLADMLITALHQVCEYFGVAPATRFYRSSELSVPGRSSQRVVDLVRYFSGDVYVTGHGAKNYLSHEAFEASGITVRYMDYQRLPYEQLHGPFNPHVSILDLIANCGRAGARFIRSSTVAWREFLARQRIAG